MKATAADIIVLMREVGIDKEIIEKLKNDKPLLNQGLDSIDLPAIAAAAETKFHVDLSDADATRLKTIDNFVAYLNEKIK